MLFFLKCDCLSDKSVYNTFIRIFFMRPKEIFNCCSWIPPCNTILISLMLFPVFVACIAFGFILYLVVVAICGGFWICCAYTCCWWCCIHKQQSCIDVVHNIIFKCTNIVKMKMCYYFQIK